MERMKSEESIEEIRQDSPGELIDDEEIEVQKEYQLSYQIILLILHYNMSEYPKY